MRQNWSGMLPKPRTVLHCADPECDWEATLGEGEHDWVLEARYQNHWEQEHRKFRVKIITERYLNAGEFPGSQYQVVNPEEASLFHSDAEARWAGAVFSKSHEHGGRIVIEEIR